MANPQGPNQRWSLDFLSDTFADGRRFRILAVVDDFTRECLTLIADTSLSGLRVVRELEAVIAHRGRPVSRGAQVNSPDAKIANLKPGG
jgi:putative transposase